MLTAHLAAAFSVLVGGIGVYMLASASRPRNGRDGQRLGWLALMLMGILASLFFLIAAAIACVLIVALLAQLGVYTEAGRALEMLVWPLIGLPVYVAVFTAGAFRPLSAGE